MLSRMKKFVSVIACAALLCTMVIIPAQAATESSINYLVNEDFEGASTAFTGGNFTVTDIGGRHGKVMKLNLAGSSNLVSSAVVDTEAKDLVFSADLYFSSTATPIAINLNGKGDNSPASTVAFKNGIVHSGGNLNYITTAPARNDGAYTVGKWHNLTVYINYDAATGIAKNGRVYLDGVWLRAPGSEGTGITGIDIASLANGSASGNVYVDNVKMFYDEAGTFVAEAYHDGENIYVNTSNVNNTAGNWNAGTMDAFGTAENKKTQLIDCYTGDSVDYDIISQTGNQFVIRPKTALTGSKPYAVQLPVLKTFNKGTELLSTEIYFTAEPSYVDVRADETTEHSFKTTSANITISEETDGSVKVTNKDTYNEAVTYGDSTNWVTTKSKTSRYLEASLDFKVDTEDFYGRIFFHYVKDLNVVYSIRKDGKIGVNVANKMPGNDDTTTLITGITYNVGEWNTLGIRYDKVTDTFTACVNGTEYDLSAYRDKWDNTQLADGFKIYYYTNRFAAGTTTEIYFDNVYIANSATGVDRVKIGEDNVWTKDVSLAAATAEVTFTDDLKEGSADVLTHFSLKADGTDEELVKSVTYDAATKKATLTLGQLASDTEYTFTVSDVTDGQLKYIVPYTAKFHTEKTELKGIKLVNADGSEITKSALDVDSVVYAKPDMTGSIKAAVIITQYNNGLMTDAEIAENIVLSENMAVTDMASLTITDKNNLELKAFIWDSIDGLRPLVDVAEY